MEYTVIFTKYHMNTGKEILFETTGCSDDPTTLKREVTKMAKAIEPFALLLKERPLSWDTYGYNKSESYGKTWTEYMRNIPVTDGSVYKISISRTSNTLDTVSRKINDAEYELTKALEELQKNYAYNPDLSKIDPGLPEIIDVKLPDHITALIDIFETVKTRISKKVDELNSKVV